MNRIDMRQQIRDLLAWDTSETNKKDVDALNRSIRQGYDIAVQECPEAFFPATMRMRVPASIASGAATIATTSDPWVMTFTGLVPTTDGTWNGVYSIEIQHSSRVLRFQCREFFSTAGPTAYHVTLDRPWPLASSSGLGFTLVAQYAWMPTYWGRLQSAVRFGSMGGPLTLRNYSHAALLGQTRNLNYSLSGPPMELRMEKTYQQPAPNVAPDGEVDDGVWTDFEPIGTFTYCFTYCWGYRDALDKSPGGNFVPLFESSPSPVSVSLVVPDFTSVVNLKLPDIDFELGFHTTGTLRSTHSGVYKRIYRARSAVTSGTNSSIEAPSVYQFLADIGGQTVTYTDNGTVTPDYTLRLPESHSYAGWTMWPTPSDATELDLNVLCRPPALDNDYDAFMMAPEYSTSVSLLCASWLAKGRDTDDAKAQNLLQEARMSIARLRADQANPTGSVTRLGFDRPAPYMPLRAKEGRP